MGVVGSRDSKKRQGLGSYGFLGPREGGLSGKEMGMFLAPPVQELGGVKG